LVSTYDTLGGAAKATYRLHRALLSIGVESLMLVKRKLSDDPTVIGHEEKKEQPPERLIKSFLDKAPILIHELVKKKRLDKPFSIEWMPSLQMLNLIKEINPDIVHLNWICNGALSIEDISSIKKPMVWTLHDMWPFTGGCHYSENCNRYEDNCGKCKIISSGEERDLSRFIWSRKKKSLSKIANLTIVGVSRWIADCARRSSIFKGRTILNIPNPVRTDVFKPSRKVEARRFFGFPEDKKLILFGAFNAMKDRRKGFYELTKALHKIKREDVELVVFGISESKSLPNFGFKTHYMREIKDEQILAMLYCAGDVMVVPSLQESFGQTAAEALSCGTPVVAFGCTGLLDIVDHKINGYLAKPYDTDDLKRGIEWILNAQSYEELSKRARQKVVEEFDSKVVAKRFARLYQEILNPRGLPSMHNSNCSHVGL